MREAATRFIYHRLRDGNYLGILSFSTEVEQLLAVTKVTKATRDLMAQTLPKDTQIDTAIGAALLESIRVSIRNIQYVALKKC